jgi:hypothetical protein
MPCFIPFPSSNAVETAQQEALLDSEPQRAPALRLAPA